MFRGTAPPRPRLSSPPTTDTLGKVDSTRGFLGEIPAVTRGTGGSQNNWGAGWGAGGRAGRVANLGVEVPRLMLGLSMDDAVEINKREEREGVRA